MTANGHAADKMGKDAQRQLTTHSGLFSQGIITDPTILTIIIFIFLALSRKSRLSKSFTEI